MRRVSRLRAYIVYAIILFIVISMTVGPATAFTEMTIPFITTGDTIFLQPTAFADATIIEFNGANTTASSLETLDIDFPAFADGAHAGPIIAPGTVAIDGALTTDGAAFNVLPFGPVDLAFPSISQTAEETYAFQRTYFFVDASI